VATQRSWGGFSAPNYTQVPDEFFDDLMVDLSEAELRVLLYLMRRTFGFKKHADAISLKQIINGIQTRDGRVIDRGAGLSHTSVKRGIKGLVERGVIRVEKVRSEDGDYETNIYAIVFKGEGTQVAPGRQQEFLPLSQGRQEEFLPVGNGGAEGVGTRSAPQETVVQQTVRQETDPSNDSNDNIIVMSREDAERIAWVINDVSREFADQAPAKSSATRACRIFVQSGLELEAFLDVVQQARLRTKRYTGGIKTERLENGAKPKMGYFFGVLEDLAKGEDR
jgi:hypothetical protein